MISKINILGGNIKRLFGQLLCRYLIYLAGENRYWVQLTLKTSETISYIKRVHSPAIVTCCGSDFQLIWGDRRVTFLHTYLSMSYAMGEIVFVKLCFSYSCF